MSAGKRGSLVDANYYVMAHISREEGKFGRFQLLCDGTSAAKREVW
jgi:hypothetical protein